MSNQAEQLRLFELGLSLGPIKEARDRLMHQAAKSEKTWKSYAETWRMFVAWCESAGRIPLPASSETVELFVAWSVDVRKYRLATIALVLASIRDRHRQDNHADPVNDQVLTLFRNARKAVKERPRRKAITPDLLLRLLSTLDGRNDQMAIRDRALLATFFFSGWRRSEVASLDYPRDVVFDHDGVTLELGASKTDQTGEYGRTAFIPFRGEDPCPAKLLKDYIEARGSKSGPLWLHCLQFHRTLKPGLRLKARAMLGVIKELLERAGIDPAPYTAHSFRSGMVTSSLQAGADAYSIMQRTGHSNLATLKKYIRRAQAWRHDPMKNVKFPARAAS